MKITREAQAEARRLIRLCINASGLLDEKIVRQIASRIEAERPRHWLPLLTAFKELVRLEVKRRTATITSAVPLTEAEQAQIRAKLDARKTGLRYSWQVDPALVAGLTVQVGDDVTDASVKSRIQRLSLI